MKLERLTERIWFLPFEARRDRPNLIYIRGDRWSLAVDAGHSDDHTAAFCRAIEAEGLPLPKLAVLTHWHWDHTFGMHAFPGLCLANARTNACLLDFRKKLAREGVEVFLSFDECIRAEYAGNKPVVIVPADLTFTGEMALELGSCPVRIFEAPSPHTDDSTLVYAEGEKALFLGDAAGGVFPTWEKDMALAGKLAGIVGSLDAEICLQGHWTPQSRREIIEDLLAEDS